MILRNCLKTMDTNVGSTSFPPITHSSKKPPKLLDRVRNLIRTRHYSSRTEQTYLHWIERFIMFNGKRHPKDMGALEVEAFLTDLAVRWNVSASTQNLALSAILFLYREVLGIDLPWLSGVTRAKKPQRLPTVLTRREIERLLQALPDDLPGLIVRLLCGSGMRLMEGVRLRVKDVDLDGRQIVVRDGKGAKDRVTMLPDTLVAPMTAHLAVRRTVHQRDVADGRASVYLPDALARKYPSAAAAWHWQYVFAAATLSTDPRSGDPTLACLRGNSTRHDLVGLEIIRHHGQNRSRAVGYNRAPATMAPSGG